MKFDRTVNSKNIFFSCSYPSFPFPTDLFSWVPFFYLNVNNQNIFGILDDTKELFYIFL